MSTPGDEVAPRPTRQWTRADTIALPLVAVAAGVIRLIRVTIPARQIFDEVYYVRDACWYFVHRSAVCQVGAEKNLEHPPLGKDLIGIGIKVFGFDAFGWRIASVLFGTAMVVLTYLLARKLLKSTPLAVLASGLVGIDFLAFVQSRIAMLDIFVAALTVAAFLFVVYDRDEILGGGRHGIRPWRLAAGAACGLAIATKWSGIFTLLAVLILSIAWEMHASDRSRRGALIDAVRREGLSIGAAFVALPLALYTLTFVGHIHGDLFVAPWREGAWFHEFYQRQLLAARYHIALTKVNPLQSSPWSWLLLKRAFPYFREITASGQRLTIQAGGSPVTWWLAVPSILWVTIQWFRHNSPLRAEGVIVAGFWMNFLPWLGFAAAPFLIGSQRSGMYLFYALPLVPFMCLAQALIARDLWRWIAGRVAVIAFAAASIAAFVFYYPFLTAMPLSESSWSHRIWIFDNCERPDRSPIVLYNEKTEHGRVTTEITSLGRHFLPPLGWCWVEYGSSNARVGLKGLIGDDSLTGP